MKTTQPPFGLPMGSAASACMIAQATSACPVALVREAEYEICPLSVTPCRMVRKAWAMSFCPASHLRRCASMSSFAFSTSWVLSCTE